MEKSDENVQAFSPETVKIADLKPHSRNYRQHPDDQVAHLVESVRQHGLYRNIIIAEDSTILAGHGVVLACRKLGIEDVPVVRLLIAPDDPKALKILAGDNEISHLGQIDDRALTVLLKEVMELDPDGLLGTGYDEKMLSTLVMVTRPRSEIEGMDEAAEWLGLPEFDSLDQQKPHQIIVNFDSPDDRKKFLRVLSDSGGGLMKAKEDGRVWSAWWPRHEKVDESSVIFEG